MATLYVNADSDTRSDAWTYLQAADTPAKPFASMQAAAMLLTPGDTMQVEPSTLGNANPDDPFDTDVYAGFTHREQLDQSDILPHGSNDGSATINVVGHVVSGVRPKCRLMNFYSLENWSISHFQRGYDRGGGHDSFTLGRVQICKDLTFTDIVQTGGGFDLVGGRGTLHFFQCTTYSPLQVGNSNYLNGVGFHIFGWDTSSGDKFDVLFKFEQCWFEDVQGEDAIQASLGLVTDPADLEVIGCHFKDILYNASGIHTDCTQVLGGRRVTLIDNTYENCSSCYIASDEHLGLVEIIGNYVDEDCLNGFLGQGTDKWVVLHNTIRATQLPFGLGNRFNQTDPSFEQLVIAVNNVYGFLQIDGGTVLADASVIEHNISYLEPGRVTPWGTQLDGLPEFGPSARLVAADIDTAAELATLPAPSPGIAAGRSLSGLDLSDDEIAYAAADRLGRAYGSPRDVGAFQGDGSDITAASRPPYVMSTSPLGDGAGQDVSPTLVLYPKPGEEIDPSTVTTTTVWVSERSHTFPAVVTLSDLDGDGFQTVTIDLKLSLSPLTEGRVLPLTSCTVHVDGVSDTEGSDVRITTWGFQVAGPDDAAIEAVSAGEEGPDSTTFMSGGFLRDAATRALVVVAQ